jgi:hypothetical protein
LEQDPLERDRRVEPRSRSVPCPFDESGCSGLQPKLGGKFHLKLNIGTRPIANKYCEGKMKSTLKRELKVRETVLKEAIGVSSAALMISDQPGTKEIARLLGTGWDRSLFGVASQPRFAWAEKGIEKVVTFVMLQLCVFAPWWIVARRNYRSLRTCEHAAGLHAVRWCSQLV